MASLKSSGKAAASNNEKVQPKLQSQHITGCTLPVAQINLTSFELFGKGTALVETADPHEQAALIPQCGEQANVPFLRDICHYSIFNANENQN
jgi:hypothetical protein